MGKISSFTPEGPDRAGFQHGTPSLAMLPAANFKFSVVKKEHKIVVPRKGTYHDIAPEVFTEAAGDFNLYDEKSKIMWLPAVQKVLLATGQYPDMEPNQMFVPISLKFGTKDVEIVGQIIEMLMP